MSRRIPARTIDVIMGQLVVGYAIEARRRQVRVYCKAPAGMWKGPLCDTGLLCLS